MKASTKDRAHAITKGLLLLLILALVVWGTLDGLRFAVSLEP